MAHMRTRLYSSTIVSAILTMGIAATTSADELWSLAVGVDEDNGETVATMRQESGDSIRDESGKKDIYPVLEFQCAPGSNPNIRFRIDWRRFISSFNTEVGFRVDDGKALWLKLGVDPTNEITVSKSAADVGKLVQLMSDAKTVEVEVAPYSEPSVFAGFNISTLESTLDTLSGHCK